LLKLNTREELHEVGNIVKKKYSMLQEMDTIKFSVGQKVSFRDKRGDTITGEIIKINRKSIEVKTMLGNWRISSSLLKLEEEIRGRNEKEIY
jgi:hypothetical protein